MIDKEEIDDALFWADLHGIKDVEFKTLHEWLADGGYVPPASPPDDRISAELNTLLGCLAGLGVVVEFADHLTDRELHSWLMDSGHLNGHMAPLPDSFIHMSPIGGCSNEDNQVWLTYYATDQDRDEWKTQYPDETLPDRKPLVKIR